MAPVSDSLGIAGVQARIAEIRGQFSSHGGRIGTPLGAPMADSTLGAGGGTALELGGGLSFNQPTGGGATLDQSDNSAFAVRLRDLLARAGVTTATPSPAVDEGPPINGGFDWAPISGGTVGPSGVDHAQFGRDLLARLNLPVTSENVRAIDAWARAEGTRATNNPLATTQGWDGATKFNSVGVRNYTSYEDGIAATVRTITNGHYPNIIDALRQGTDAMAVARAIAASPWGTGHGVERVLQSQ